MKISKLINKSLRSKLVFGIALSILPFLVMFFLILNHLTIMNEIKTRNEKHLNELRLIAEARAALPLAVMRFDHYIIGNNIRELGKFQQSLKLGTSAIDKLAATRTFNRKETALINATHREWQQAMALGQDIKLSSSRQKTLIKEQQFDKNILNILPKLAQVNDIIWSELAADSSQAHKASSSLVTYMTMAFVAELLIILLLLIISSRSIVVPLKILTDKIERLGEGDLSARINISGSDEISILAQKYNNMAEKLESTYAEIKGEEERFRSIADTAVDAIIISDRDEKIIFWNHAAEQLFGYSIAEALGQPLSLIMPEHYRQAHAIAFKRYLKTEEKHIIGDVIALEGLKKDATVFPLELSLATWKNKDSQYFSAIIRDITARKRYEEKLKYLAVHDGLTGLFNHLEFYRQLERELSRSRRYNSPLSLLMADIDNFKQINDVHGHIAGDKVLKTLAKLLKTAVRQTDTVARYGGEEFTIILPMLGAEEALAGGERIRRLISSTSIDIGKSRTVRVTISIGATTCPEDGTSAAELVANADKALYQAKQQGKDRVQVYKEVGA